MLMACFMLAEKLHLDIGEVLGWPYRKIDWWMAYFEAKERRSK